MGIRRLRRALERGYIARDLLGLTCQDESPTHEALETQNAQRRDYNKGFVIGYNKTGTTTLERVILDLGLRMQDQKLQEELTTHILSSGRHDILQGDTPLLKFDESKVCKMPRLNKT